MDTWTSAENGFFPPRVNLAAAGPSPLKRRRMPRVLIPSDNRDFAAYLARAYREAGWEVVMGAVNFDLADAEFDLVHIQWPEELAQWAERALAAAQRKAVPKAKAKSTR